MEKPLQTQLGLFRGLVKSQFSPISPNPQAAFRPSSSVFSISCVWSASCTLLRETFQKDKRQSDRSGASFRVAKAAFGGSCGGAAL